MWVFKVYVYVYLYLEENFIFYQHMYYGMLMSMLLKGTAHTKNPFIIYSPMCRSKPVYLYYAEHKRC